MPPLVPTPPSSSRPRQLKYDVDCSTYVTTNFEQVCTDQVSKIETEFPVLNVIFCNSYCEETAAGVGRLFLRRQRRLITNIDFDSATAARVTDAAAAITADPERATITITIDGVDEVLLPASSQGQATFAPTSSAEPTAAPTIMSCPANYAQVGGTVPSGTASAIRSVNGNQACADLCSLDGPVYSGYGCLGFTTSLGITNEFGYTPTDCVLITGDSRVANAAVPCAAGKFCCTADAPPPTPPPTRHAYCPAGYADYGVRFNWGLGRVTVVANHEACAARCTQFSASRYNGGCKGYMTGMYSGMVFCRSYGGLERSIPCAPWAVPWNQGVFSGALGTTHPRSGQRNIGGNCCSRTSSVVEQMGAALGPE